jgi:nucleoside-diphosphate-sugar epimerase
MSVKLKILMTGASGFIGSHLLKKLLSNDYTVGVISRCKPQNVNITWIEIDANLNEKIVSFMPDITIHLAANFDNKNIASILECNIELPLKIIETISKLPIKNRNFLYAGSYWQNGDFKKPGMPIDLYSASKKAIKNFIDYYATYKNLNSLELVLYGSYGGNDNRKKLLDLLIASVSANQSLEISAGEQELNLVHIDDICDAFIIGLKMLGETFYHNQSYSVVSNYTYDVLQIISLIENTAEKKANLDIGARSYRDVEVFKPVYFESVLPHWVEKNSLKKYIKKTLNEQ